MTLKSHKVLIIDEMHDSISEMLEHAGFTPDYQPRITKEEIVDMPDIYVGMIVRSKVKIDALVLDSKPSIKFIGRAGAGVDNLDMNYLLQHDIAMVNAPEGNRDALGEHVIGMLLSLSNNLRQADLQVRDFVWDREGNRGFEIGGKVVALLGYGYMGSAVAEKLSGFGCEVIAHDKYKSGFSNQWVREAALDEIFARADIFSIHVPLTNETRNLVDIDFLNSFQKPIIVINSARGEVLKTADLVQTLKSGKVRAAALDVLENEKLGNLSADQKAAYTQLFQMKNVMLSPHVAGWSFESYENINRVLVDKIAKLDILGHEESNSQKGRA